MKILYVITKSNWGGAQRYVFDLARSATERGHTAAVVLGGNGELAARLHRHHIRTISLPDAQRDIHIARDWKTYHALKKIFEEEAPDVVHLNSSKIGMLGAIAGRRAEVPEIIFTAHGWAFTEERGWISRQVFKFIQWTTVLMSTITITVSKTTRDELSLPFVENKMTTIHNGISPIPLLHQRQARRELLEHTPFSGMVDVWKIDTLWVGSIAELHPNKGLAYAIEAIARLRDEFEGYRAGLVYFIIGEGEMRPELEALIRKHRLETEVYLVGHIENAAALLSAFDIYLSPSVKEGLPYAILEAGAAELPVVASDVGGTREVIEDGVSGLIVEPRESGQIAQALLDLAKDADKRTSLGSALKKNVMAEFNEERMVKRTLSLYKHREN